MKNLVIIGARGFAREIYHLATQCRGYSSEFMVKGFLDDKTDALDGIDGYPGILGAVESYNIQPDDVFICALGDTKWKQHYVNLVLAKDGVFHTLIHPTAIVNPNAKIARGSIISSYVTVSCEVTLEEFVTIQSFSAIGHDARIGTFCHLNAYAFVGGGVRLEEGVTLHTGAKVLPYKKVGAWATAGAGSVVIRNVRPAVTVFGAPATEIFDSGN